MLRGPAVGLLWKRDIVRHSGRRSNISGVGVWHVRGRARHSAILVGRRHVVLGASVGGHVAGGIHVLLGKMVLVVMIVVAMGGRIVLGPPPAARRRTPGGHRAHVDTPLHRLPSRQMPAVVHRAGVGRMVMWLLR